MALPKIRVNKSKLLSLFRLSDDDLKKHASSATGDYTVVVMDALLADILHDLSIIRRKLGVSQIDLEEHGYWITDTINALMAGTLRFRREAKEERAQIRRLCELIGQLTIGDFTALKEFWGLSYTPRKIAQAIQSRANKLRMEPTEDLILAVETLKFISAAPAEEIPVCF